MNKNKAKVHYSHNTDHWATPKKMYEKYINDGFIDPCPLHCKEDNRNKIYKNQKIFINPPYSDIKNWVQFIKNNIKDNQIHLLIPARTSILRKIRHSIFGNINGNILIMGSNKYFQTMENK